jgi:hypothetical protein
MAPKSPLLLLALLALLSLSLAKPLIASKVIVALNCGSRDQ